MENAKTSNEPRVGANGHSPLLTVEKIQQDASSSFKIEIVFKKLRGGFLLVIGFMLSPLSWWNDLFFNLPIAYFFGYVCSLVYADLLVPCAIAGYWVSNIAGIFLMQLGAVDILQNQPKQRNLKQELLTGVISSSAYTIVILALLQFKILTIPVLFSGS